MITITEGLYAHRAGTTLILSDQPQLPRTTALHSRLLIVAEDHASLKHQLRKWLSGHQLDEIAAAMQISRSAAHRLRAAMGITKRGSYSSEKAIPRGMREARRLDALNAPETRAAADRSTLAGVGHHPFKPIETP